MSGELQLLVPAPCPSPPPHTCCCRAGAAAASPERCPRLKGARLAPPGRGAKLDRGQPRRPPPTACPLGPAPLPSLRVPTELLRCGRASGGRVCLRPAPRSRCSPCTVRRDPGSARSPFSESQPQVAAGSGRERVLPQVPAADPPLGPKRLAGLGRPARPSSGAPAGQKPRSGPWDLLACTHPVATAAGDRGELISWCGLAACSHKWCTRLDTEKSVKHLPFQNHAPQMLTFQR